MNPSRNMPPEASPLSLKEAVERGGFYPSLVLHTVQDALDGREPSHQIVHVDTHFDMEEVHRHITVLALAENVVVVAHLDDHDADEEPFTVPDLPRADPDGPPRGPDARIPDGKDLDARGPEDGGREGSGEVLARISTEVVPVSRIRSLILSEVHRQPEQFRPDRGLAEVTLNMNWTGGARFDSMPADCGNPECMADHGDTGSVIPEDITLRIAATAEGDTAVDEARRFVRALRRACVRFAQ